MRINQNCFKVLKSLGLPMTVEVRNKAGRYVTKAVIDVSGEVLDLSTGVVYAHPSAMRAALIEANGSTYSRLYLNGVDLRSLGVRP